MNKDINNIIKKNKYRSKFYQQYSKGSKAKKHVSKQTGSYRFNSITNKILVCVILFLVLLISKNSEKLGFIYNTTFKNMNFMQVKAFVDQNLNGIFPKTDDENKYVDAVVIELDSTSTYRDGLIIETDFSSPVQSCVDGIVIRIYKDDDLGKLIVIQDENGYEYHYGYLDNIDIGLYQSVSYGEVIGVGRNNELMQGEYYLAIKDGLKFLDALQVINNEN